jgi:Cu2+-containing amine oxidase
MKKPIKEMNEEELKEAIEFCNNEIESNRELDFNSISIGLAYDRIKDLAEKLLNEKIEEKNKST